VVAAGLSVWVATTPLAGPTAALFARLADTAAAAGLAPLAAAAAPHAVVVLASEDGGDSGGGAWAFDFLPAEPLAPATALALARGRSVPGVGRARRLPAGVPRARCVKLGPAAMPDPLAHARATAAAWNGAPLSVLGRGEGVDCVSAAAGLAAALAAVEEGVVRAALEECTRTGGRSGGV